MVGLLLMTVWKRLQCKGKSLAFSDFFSLSINKLHIHSVGLELTTSLFSLHLVLMGRGGVILPIAHWQVPYLLYVICDLKTWCKQEYFSNVLAQLCRYSKKSLIQMVCCNQFRIMHVTPKQRKKWVNFNSKYDSYLTLVFWGIFYQSWN